MNLKFLPHIIGLALALALPVSNSSTAKAEKCQYGGTYLGAAELTSLNSRDLFASAPNFEQSVSATLAESLEQRFQETFNLTQADLASVSIYSAEHGYWTSSAGQGADVKPFWLASIGKLATAIVIGQLMEEKLLRPEDTIDRWFPDMPNADLITIDQLLRHTSGLPNFNHIESVQNQTSYKSPTFLLNASVTQGLDFCPGTDWYYSNTGYLVLAIIAEKLDQRNYADIIQSRISTPLKLQDFKVVTLKDDPNSLVIAKDKPSSEFVSEIASIHGAGSIVSSTKDAILFLSAFLRGDLISDSGVADSLAGLYPLFESSSRYGRGVMVTDVPDLEHPTVWVGHSGGAPFGKALLLFDLKRKTYLAIALNTQAPAEAIANALLKQLD